MNGELIIDGFTLEVHISWKWGQYGVANLLIDPKQM